MRSTLSYLVCSLVVATAAACGGAPELAEADRHPGRQVFVDKGCAGCHGERGEAVRTAPELVELDAHWDPDTLVAYLRDPDGIKAASSRLQFVNEQYPVQMPPIKATDEELELLAGYVLQF